MSYQRALAAVNLRETDLIPQIEYLAHAEFVHKISGIDPFERPAEAEAETYRRLDLDLVWYTELNRLVDPQLNGDRAVTEWGWAGSVWRTHFPFQTVEEVLSYDPLAATGEWNMAAKVQQLADEHGERQALYGQNALVPGGYYTTLFMWGVMIFGWELMMVAAASEPRRFNDVLKRFLEISVREVEAWSQVDIEVFISHDDLAMTKGPIFRPDWFREHIFPHYPQIWKPLKDKGIKIIFCSDGNYGPLIDDIAAAGADGFIIEPSVDLQTVVGKYGGRKAIIGNVDTKVLTFEGEKEIEAEVKRCVSTAGHHPGFFINAVGGIPHNIPLKNVEAYFAACRKYRSRKVTT